MKFCFGLCLGMLLTATVWTLSAQTERAMHPRIAAAIDALRDARAYMESAPHNFGGHKGAAIQASSEAIRQLNLALSYRAEKDGKRR